MIKKNKNKNFDNYIEIAKTDILVYIIFSIIIFLILLYISYKVKWYYLLFGGIIVPIRTIEKFQVYIDLKKIKLYLINNNILEKIGNIDFWNENNYFLTDNYMIIMYKKNIHCFEYSKVIAIYKENRLKLNNDSKYEKYLHIVLDDGLEFEILIFSTILVNEKYNDISEYLMKKNNNIKLEKEINNNKINVVRL